jgi:LPS export ABC transporter protein LptC
LPGSLFVIFALMGKSTSVRVFGIVALMLGLRVLSGCENDIERVQMLTDESTVPRVKASNVKVIYSDSARVKVQILAPEFQQYSNVERPYMEFPDGIEVFFYDDSMKIESEIRADYTIYYSQERLWHATGNVVARRLDNGDALHTEELFWDEASELIYSDAYTRIQNEDGIFYGKRGFESDQNLSNWQLKGTSGTVNVQDEE